MTPTTMRVLRAFEGTGTMVFEGKKHRLFHGKDGYIFTLVLHPQDVPLDLMRAKLGAAWTIALIPDAEEGERQESEQQPSPPPSPEKGLHASSKLSNDAFWMCRRRDFMEWLGALDEAVADARIKSILGIRSKTELDRDPEAALRWAGLVAKFHAATTPEPTR